MFQVKKMIALWTDLGTLKSKRTSRHRSAAKKAKRNLVIELLEIRRVFAAFTPGNLAIYRVGNGTETLAGTGNSVFIDEFTPAGSLVQSIALPNNGAASSLVASGTSTSEGALTRSVDGNYLFLAGYGPESIPSAASLSGSTAATVNRVIGRISADGTIDTSTRLADAATSGTPRGAASSNGTDLWFSGSTGGVRFTTLGGTSSTQVSTGFTNARALTIFDNQLYVSAAVAAGTRVATVGTGLPTTSQPVTNLPGSAISGLSSPYGMFFADLSPSVPGVDTLYVADDGVSGLQKLSFVGGSWVSNGVIGVDADDYRGVTGIVSGGNVNLYITRKGGGAAGGAGEFVTLIDMSGYNGSFSGTPTLLASAPANTSFRGIALTPGVATSAFLAIGATDASKLEGDSGLANPFTFTISRSGETSGTSSVTWSAMGSGPNPVTADDFVGNAFPSGVLNFAANEISKTITLDVLADSLVEFDEGVTVELSNPSNATITTSSAVGLVINDDAATEYQIVGTDLTKLEGTGAATDFTFTVNRSGVTSGVTTVDYAITGAVDVNDATSPLTGSLTFAEGETSKLVTLTVIGDTLVEANEMFTVTLSNPSAGTVIAIATASGTILNDDASIAIATNVVRLAEGNAGTTQVTYTLTRTGYLFGAVSADWSVGSGVSDPVDGTDFIGGVFPSGTVNFPGDGATTTQTISINVQGDTVLEADETFVVVLSNPSLGVTITGTGNGLVENDEVLPLQPGDIVITGMDSVAESLSFVPLVALPPNRIVKFTDAGWSGSSFLSSEGFLTFTTGPSGIAAGTEVTVTNVNTTTPTVIPTEAGTAVGEVAMTLVNSGENLFVFQGPRVSPEFLFAINFGGPYLTSGTVTSTTTYLPSSLTIGTSAVQNLNGISIGQYNDVIVTGSKNQIRDAVANSINWLLTGPLTAMNFTVTASSSTVVNRQIFYNRSPSAAFGDGSGNPVNAIDPSKSALLPGQSAQGSNYTNYHLGINGLVVDIQGLNSATAADFSFATSSGVLPFVNSMATATVTVLAGQGLNGSSRVKVEFPDKAISNTWLQVTVLANANTGLSANDVFYFGNAIGDFEVGNVAGPPVVVRTDASDVASVRLNQSNVPNSASISNPYDVNKDGRVNAIDTAIVRQNFADPILTFFASTVSLQLASVLDSRSAPVLATGTSETRNPAFFEENTGFRLLGRPILLPPLTNRDELEVSRLATVGCQPGEDIDSEAMGESGKLTPSKVDEFFLKFGTKL